MSGEYNSSAQRTSLWVTAGRVIFTLALIGCIAFIFSNSMKIASVSTVSSGRVWFLCLKSSKNFINVSYLK